MSRRSSTETLTEWLRSKGIRAECLACGTNRWIDEGIIAAPVLTGGAADRVAEHTVHMVPLVCTNCGYVRLFSAKMVGLV